MTCDRVVKILILATFRIHYDISFSFDQKPERNFFGEQCYCGCTSPVNKDREWINVPQCIALETVKYTFAIADSPERKMISKSFNAFVLSILNKYGKGD